MSNLTEIAEYTATVPVPDDGTDANAASLAAMVKPLANRTKFLNETVLGSTSWALATATGTGSAPLEGTMAIASQKTGAGYTIAGNRLVVPAAGTYIVLASFRAKSDDTTDNLYFTNNLYVGGSSVYNVRGVRPGTSASNEEAAPPLFYIATIATPASEGLSLAISTGLGTVNLNSSQLLVLRIPST